MASAAGAFILCVLVAAGVTSVQQKIELIESEKLAPGARVTFTPAELIAHGNQEAAAVAPGAVHDLRLELGSGKALGFARVDFLKLNQSQGQPPSWLLSKLLEGQRPVSVTARLESQNGRARVEVERVEVSGVAIEGRALDFLIQSYVIPAYPEARVGQWFELAHHVDRIEVTPQRVSVVIGRR